MDLPKENPIVENQLEGFVSKPEESAVNAASQLEPLLNLLLELKIVTGVDKKNPASKHDSSSESSSENGEAGILGGLNDLLGISEAVEVNITPQTPVSESKSSDSQAGLDKLNNLRFVTQKLHQIQNQSLAITRLI
jgi:hypothetical protein